MIWFTCRRCGKTHGRAESSIGTLVFCDCGEGNLVPWESTTAAPPRPPEPAPAPDVPAPTLEPLSFDPPEARPEAKGYNVLPPAVTPRSRRRRIHIDPNFCLNHSTTPRKQTCTDCREAFCEECLVTFQGETLCGPCKNFRIRTLDAPPHMSALALVSAILGLVTGPLALCLLPWATRTGVSVLTLVALLPQVAALALGILALRQTERTPRVAGWSLALTGLLTASVASMLTVLVTLFGPRLGV